MVSGNFDLFLTSSTISMQTVANANRGHRTVQVFGAVADPAAAGIGIDMSKPLAQRSQPGGHWKFHACRQGVPNGAPDVSRPESGGVSWNASEPNSRAFVIKAREVCQQLGISLLEANVDNTAGVGESIDSLISRGAQAIWVGGDVTLSVPWTR